jgi:glucose-6-phosphate isomerase
MDRHVKLTDGIANLALLAAFADLYYTQARRAQSRAVFAYDERLRLLPDYLQQLEMESNGKSVTADGKPLGRPSAPVTWGGVGTDAQHAVFQLLHQGTTAVPVEFVAVIENEDSVDPRHHQLLLGNCFAQGAALMVGREDEEGARAYPGDRPSSTILLERLDARSLGALIAFMSIGPSPTPSSSASIHSTSSVSSWGRKWPGRWTIPKAGRSFDPSTRDLIGRAGL